MELRNAAMVMVGLRMGLRASDITNIKQISKTSYDSRCWKQFV